MSKHTCNPGKSALLGRYGIRETNQATFSADNFVSAESNSSGGGSNALKYLVIKTDLPVTSATNGFTYLISKRFRLKEQCLPSLPIKMNISIYT